VHSVYFSLGNEIFFTYSVGCGLFFQYGNWQQSLTVLSHVLFNEVNAAIAMCLLFSKARHIMPSTLDALV
jgi:hypothetical protein